MRFWLDLLALWLMVCAALLALHGGLGVAAALTIIAAMAVRYLGCVAEGVAPPELRRWLTRPDPAQGEPWRPARLRGRGVAFHARKKLRLRR